jgi:hypothetical protein
LPGIGPQDPPGLLSEAVFEGDGCGEKQGVQRRTVDALAGTGFRCDDEQRWAVSRWAEQPADNLSIVVVPPLELETPQRKELTTSALGRMTSNFSFAQAEEGQLEVDQPSPLTPLPNPTSVAIHHLLDDGVPGGCGGIRRRRRGPKSSCPVMCSPVSIPSRCKVRNAWASCLAEARSSTTRCRARSTSVAAGTPRSLATPRASSSWARRV